MMKMESSLEQSEDYLLTKISRQHRITDFSSVDIFSRPKGIIETIKWCASLFKEAINWHQFTFIHFDVTLNPISIV